MESMAGRTDCIEGVPGRGAKRSCFLGGNDARLSVKRGAQATRAPGVPPAVGLKTLKTEVVVGGVIVN